MPSREGVPVDVVGRPSMGEGRTPGAGDGGMDSVRFAGVFVASAPAGARESATLRLRKAMVSTEMEFTCPRNYGSDAYR